MPTHRNAILDRNWSSRNHAPIVRAVLHTTEGLGDAMSLRNYFNRPGVEASAHEVVDRAGNRVTCVPDLGKAWTQASYNPGSLSIEQVGFASTSRRDWIVKYHNQLCTVARSLARWHRRHGIPLRHSVPNGVCQHRNLGQAGGGHNDCGQDYPEHYVTVWARYWFYRRYRPYRIITRRRLRKVLVQAQRAEGVHKPRLGWR